MNIEYFRENCLSLGDVTEKTPFGKFAARFDSVLVFYVCEHMFCMVDMDDFHYAVVKNKPEKIAELHETINSVERQCKMSTKYWILCGAKRQADYSSISVVIFPIQRFSTS